MKIEEVLSLQKFWYTAYGLWNPAAQRWFQKVYAFFVNSIFNFGVVICMILYVFQLKDFEDTVSFLYLCLTEVAFLFKLTNFYLRQSTILSLLQTIQNELDYCEPEEIEEIATKQVKSVKQFNVIYYSVALSCLAFAYITPLLAGDRIFPFPSYYPVDWEHNNLLYGLLYSFQVLGITSTCFVNASCDTVMSTLMCVLGFLYEILGKKLENLGKETSEKNSDGDNVESEKLKKCMEFHKRILNCTTELESLFSLVVFIQFSISSSVICVTAYQLSIFSPTENLTKFCISFFYIITLMVQLALPCYYGNEIIIKSDRMTRKIFSSQWVGGSRQFRKIMVIFMERLKRPAKITAGRLFGLSLQSFSSVRYIYIF